MSLHKRVRVQNRSKASLLLRAGSDTSILYNIALIQMNILIYGHKCTPVQHQMTALKIPIEKTALKILIGLV